MTVPAYIADIAEGQQRAMRLTDGGPAIYLDCPRCTSSGMRRDTQPGLPHTFTPCPWCSDEREAIRASLSTIAPAFRGLL